MQKAIAIIATLDTKGHEVAYLKKEIERRGFRTIIIDSGMRGKPVGVKPDISREEVAKASGKSYDDIEKLGRGDAEDLMMKGLKKVIMDLYLSGKINGILSIGGSDGTALASAAMRALPLGIPKLAVTPYMKYCETFAGTKDITFIHSVADISGVNVITKKIFDNAIAAITGMVEAGVPVGPSGEKAIAASMYGNTTPCVIKAKEILEENGYEVVIFCPNIGTRAMEELIQQRYFRGLLDVTTQDVVDAVMGGDYPALPNRLEVAGEVGIPQVIVPGCVDFTIRGSEDSLPPEYKNRRRYHFNPVVTLVRLNEREMEEMGRIFAKKLNKAKGPTRVLFPLRGLSMYDKMGEPLYDPKGDYAFLEALKANLKPSIELIEVDAHINDPEFAEKCARSLLELLRDSQK